MDEDYALALQLQADLFEDKSDAKSPHGSHDKEPTSLVDPYWETTDPNPDVRALFLQFNERFFWGRLAGIEVRWSPRMTLCAGLCCYEGHGGLCSVRLSVPLLKLRPRKDLVETLLHEMIHAYLFVTDNNKDHDGHGPEFHKHMYRINKEAGTNISVYHNFHDEVDAYRQHWWQCDGPCRQRKPYYGYVKRSMNRAPSKNDTWWAEHQRSCGGTYTKIKEPENYGKKKGKKDKNEDDEKKKEKEKSSVKSMDIRVFGGQGKTLGNSQATTNKINSGKFIPNSQGSVFKPTNSINKPQKTATISKAEDISLTPRSENFAIHKLINGDVTHLPGARTPDKKGAPKNKPVSQGGIAKFNDKKRSFVIPNFSDSDDDDILLCSNSLGNKPKTSVQSSNRDKTDPVVDGDSWWEDNSVSDSIVVKSDDNKTNQSETVFSFEAMGDDIDEIKDQTSECDNNDVREMLRKVWGQKQLKSNGTKGKRLGVFKSGSNNIVEIKTSFDKGKFSHKRSSADTGCDNQQPTKRQKSSSRLDIYNPNSDSDNIENSESNNHSSKLTSPITNFYKKKPQESNSSHGSLSSTNPRCDQNLSMETGNQHSSERESDNVSVGETSTCPVCNKQIQTASINEHLDLCLTMQIL